MSERVVFSSRSRRDLEAIRDFLLQEGASATVVSRFLSGLVEACDALSTFPERFPIYPHAPSWRMMPFATYLVFFRTAGERVLIGHVRHSARRPFRG